MIMCFYSVTAGPIVLGRISIQRVSLILASIAIVALISTVVLRNSMHTAPQSSIETSASESTFQTISKLETPTTRILMSNITLTVELAETQAQWSQGLSGRDSMSSDHGMLFIFNHESKWGFWMKDMKFPLDIIWFSSDRKVVYIKQNLLPCSPDNCPVFTPPVDALYVLEVNAGFVETHNILLDDSFAFLEVSALGI